MSAAMNPTGFHPTPLSSAKATAPAAYPAPRPSRAHSGSNRSRLPRTSRLRHPAAISASAEACAIESAGSPSGRSSRMLSSPKESAVTSAPRAAPLSAANPTLRPAHSARAVHPRAAAHPTTALAR